MFSGFFRICRRIYIGISFRIDFSGMSCRIFQDRFQSLKKIETWDLKFFFEYLKCFPGFFFGILGDFLSDPDGNAASSCIINWTKLVQSPKNPTAIPSLGRVYWRIFESSWGFLRITWYSLGIPSGPNTGTSQEPLNNPTGTRLLLKTKFMGNFWVDPVKGSFKKKSFQKILSKDPLKILRESLDFSSPKESLRESHGRDFQDYL